MRVGPLRRATAAARPAAAAAARRDSDDSCDGGIARAKKPLEEKLRLVTVEDSPLLNKLYARQLPRLLGVPKESVLVLSTEADARDAVDLALSFFDGSAASCERVVVLDQNIDFVAKHGVCYYGTDVARALRARGFDGLIALCSADSRDDIAARLVESDAAEGGGAADVGCGVDVVLEKSDVATLADSVLNELRARRHSPSPSSPPEGDEPGATRSRRARTRSADETQFQLSQGGVHGSFSRSGRTLITG